MKIEQIIALVFIVGLPALLYSCATDPDFIRRQKAENECHADARQKYHDCVLEDKSPNCDKKYYVWMADCEKIR